MSKHVFREVKFHQKRCVLDDSSKSKAIFIYYVAGSGHWEQGVRENSLLGEISIFGKKIMFSFLCAQHFEANFQPMLVNQPEFLSSVFLNREIEMLNVI